MLRVQSQFVIRRFCDHENTKLKQSIKKVNDDSFGSRKKLSSNSLDSSLARDVNTKIRKLSTGFIQ